MTRARSSLFDAGSTPYYHCMARCVRRAYLCGEDQRKMVVITHQEHGFQ